MDDLAFQLSWEELKYWYTVYPTSLPRNLSPPVAFYNSNWQLMFLIRSSQSVSSRRACGALRALPQGSPYTRGALRILLGTTLQNVILCEPISCWKIIHRNRNFRRIITILLAWKLSRMMSSSLPWFPLFWSLYCRNIISAVIFTAVVLLPVVQSQHLAVCSR